MKKSRNQRCLYEKDPWENGIRQAGAERMKKFLEKPREWERMVDTTVTNDPQVGPCGRSSGRGDACVARTLNFYPIIHTSRHVMKLSWFSIILAAGVRHRGRMK